MAAHNHSVGPKLSRWILNALLGKTQELVIGERRFRLTLERAFRLEEMDRGFIFFMASSSAVERRLTALAGGRLDRVRGTDRAPRHSPSN